MSDYLAPALSMEERQFLFEQRNSQHFRIFSKAIVWMYSRDAALLATANSQDLLRMQGILQGLLKAKNILTLGVAPEESAKPAEKT